MPSAARNWSLPLKYEGACFLSLLSPRSPYFAFPLFLYTPLACPVGVSKNWRVPTPATVRGSGASGKLYTPCSILSKISSAVASSGRPSVVWNIVGTLTILLKNAPTWAAVLPLKIIAVSMMLVVGYGTENTTLSARRASTIAT